MSHPIVLAAYMSPKTTSMLQDSSLILQNHVFSGPYRIIPDLWHGILEREQSLGQLKEWSKLETDALPDRYTPAEVRRASPDSYSLIPYFSPHHPSHLTIVLHYPDLALRIILLTKSLAEIDCGGANSAAHFYHTFMMISCPQVTL